MKFRSTLKLLFLFIVLVSCEQKRKYWVYFDPEIELDSLASDRLIYEEINKHQSYFSNWLNASTVALSADEYKELSNAHFVSEIQPMLYFDAHQLPREWSRFDMSFALEQVGASHFREEGLTGKGVKVGVIDGGFLGANERSSLSHIFDGGRVVAYKDFVTPDLKEYGGSKGADDNHGTDVWEHIAGVKKDRNVQFGLAIDSEYYLARTDDGRFENRREEELLIRALEWMNEQNVHLVNISLGYSTGFDDPRQNYKPNQINGKSSALTRAARVASEKKGMLLVVSAGNDGDRPFKVLSVPADAKGVVAVGSTSYKNWSKASYSSIGPESLKYLKPNVVCFSYQGTSFSAPVITGLAACMMQARPDLSNAQLQSVLEQSSHLYPYGNNYLGNGVPSCKKILSLLNSENLIEVKSMAKKLEAKRKETFAMSEEKGMAVVYHKSNERNVLFEEKIQFIDSTLTVKKLEAAKFSTVTFSKFVREIEWK